MGANVAARFLAAGYTVYGESRDPGDAQGLAREGLVLAERAGVDRTRAVDVMTQSPFGSLA